MSPSRPAKPCRHQGCPALIPASSPRPYCAEHDPGGWAGSTSRSRLPKDWGRLRARILGRDGHRCRQCGAPATEVDHVVPYSRGGTDAEANLQALCNTCHRVKTSREATQARTTRRTR